jgi:prophage maintenance system killer protein
MKDSPFANAIVATLNKRLFLSVIVLFLLRGGFNITGGLG